MAVPIIKVSRKEVERWLAAGTLGDGPLSKDLDNEYYLVVMGVRFNDRFAKNWVPWIVDTYYGDDEAVYTASALDHESVDLDFTTCPVMCYEIWQLVDEVSDYNDDEDDDYTYAQLQYRNDFDIENRYLYLYAQKLLDNGWRLLDSNVIIKAAFEVATWYEEQYCAPEGTFAWFYPTDEIKLLKAHRDLEDLRLAGIADQVTSSTHNTIDCNYADADIPF